LISINADIYTQHYGIKMLLILNRKLFQLLESEHKDYHNYFRRNRKRQSQENQKCNVNAIYQSYLNYLRLHSLCTDCDSFMILSKTIMTIRALFS